MSRADDCKTNLLLKAKTPVEGYTSIITRGELALKHLEFGLLRLSDGDWSGQTGECEYALDIYSGTVSLEITSPGGESFRRIGERSEVFGGLPSMIYLPPGTDYRINVESGPVEVAVFSASASVFRGTPRVISPGEVNVESQGRNNWRWDVYTSIGGDFPACKLLVGESVTPSGNWSNMPPHKHDAFNPPTEMMMEQICHFRVTPAQGFGIVRVYTAPNDPGPLDEAYVVRDGDSVVVPRGYHTLAAAPGYTLHCTWAMAGEIRKYPAWSYDPRHEWLRGS